MISCCKSTLVKIESKTYFLMSVSKLQSIEVHFFPISNAAKQHFILKVLEEKKSEKTDISLVVVLDL